MFDRCPMCWEPVLAVYLRSERLLLGVAEIEYPPAVCPACGGRRKRLRCLRCGGCGEVGQVVPARAVALSEDGHARWWVSGRRRRDGEALYRLHACSSASLTSHLSRL